MNEYSYNEKKLVIKKMYKILGHSKILENISIPTNLNDELSKKIKFFKIVLNDASKIIVGCYIYYCMNEIIEEYNKVDLLKLNSLIDKVLK